MKNSLVYIPNGLNSPELEILLSVAQNEINIKNKVYIVVCSGNDNYACSKNLYSSKLTCFLCKKKRSAAIKLLNGNFEIVETPKIKSTKEVLKKYNFENVYKYKFFNYENGIAAFSSYVGLTRDKNLEGFLSSNVIKKLINTSNELSKFFDFYLKKKKINKIYLFNGRLNNYRPLLMSANQLKIDVNNLEYNTFSNQMINLKKYLPTNHIYLSKLMIKNWRRKKKINYKLIKSFLNLKIKQQKLIYQNLFKINQKLGTLPSNWDVKKKNITFFCSSEDEIISGGKEYRLDFYKDQADSIEKIYKSILDNDKIKKIKFWVKIHPNMNTFAWDYMKRIYELKNKFHNLDIVEATSEVSSYSMIKNSEIIISPVSSVSIEASLFGKPVINLIKSPFNELGGTFFPKSHNELIQLILKNKLKAKSKLPAYKYYYFYLTGGTRLKSLKVDLTGIKINYFTYKNIKIDFNYFFKLIFYYTKFIDNYYFNYFLNFNLKKLKF